MKVSPSMVGRLLEEISWEGNARHYRKGGKGFENVLTVEVFQALDTLPRSTFLGKVVEALQGAEQEARALLQREIEEAQINLLPGDIVLRDKPKRGEKKLSVQPDGVITTPGVHAFLEVKRIRPGSFQPEQLARELVGVLRESGDKRPLLILVLPSDPPVAVQGRGRVSLHAAIEPHLASVLERTDPFPGDRNALEAIDSTIAWITWGRLQSIIEEQARDFESGSASVDRAVRRLARTAGQAIQWHA